MMDQSLVDRIDRLLNISQRWLTISEACQYSKMSKNTLKAVIDSGGIFASKRGGKWIVDRTSIDKYYFYDEDATLFRDVAKRVGL